jgi:transposase
VKRLVARELTLSFVPEVEQRLWRTVTRKKYQLRCDRVRLQNQLEALLEEAHIKLSSLVSDLLGVSARRMLQALADGETSPTALAALADERLRATPEQLCDALGACTELNAVYRRLLKMALEELRLIDEQIGQLDQEMASLLSQHQDAVERLAEVPGLGVDSAQQIIAEVGPTAATFPSEKCLSSWVGACPGDDESAGVTTATALQRATATCDVYSIKLRTPQPGPKEASSKSCIAAPSRAWDTIKPSGPLPIGSVG